MQHKQLAGCVGAVDIVVDGVEGDAGGAAAGMNRRRLGTRTGAPAAAAETPSIVRGGVGIGVYCVLNIRYEIAIR